MQGAVLLVAISTVKHSLGGDHRPQGALATAQCFGKRDNVRHDILILESAEPACASSTDLYLVEYRKDVVLPAQPGEFCQEARWRHFACRAAYRLYECGDYSVGAVPRRLCFDCGLHRRDVAVRHVNHIFLRNAESKAALEIRSRCQGERSMCLSVESALRSEDGRVGKEGVM